jgi:hypothetical protein
MSAMDFNNLNYEQFEVSVNQEINESHKAKRQRLSKSKNKSLKTILIILTFTFFICCIIILILYIKKRIEYSSLEKKIMDYIFFPYHSDLIPTMAILKKVKNYIKEIILEKTGKEYKPTFKMYFKATIDGDISFHDKTDKWEGYILLIKDENDNIFGGYTSKNFKGNSILDVNYGSQKNDKISFLFNLNKDEIYPVIEPNSDKHIYGDIEEGPIFGELIDSDLKIKSRFLSDKSYSEFPKNYNLKGYENNNNNDNNKLRLTNGQKYFLIKELEAFRVILLD